jgi:uncharacterized protein YbbK (DUF523 family)
VELTGVAQDKEKLNTVMKAVMIHQMPSCGSEVIVFHSSNERNLRTPNKILHL